MEDQVVQGDLSKMILLKQKWVLYIFPPTKCTLCYDTSAIIEIKLRTVAVREMIHPQQLAAHTRWFYSLSLLNQIICWSLCNYCSLTEYASSMKVASISDSRMFPVFLRVGQMPVYYILLLLYFSIPFL